MDHFAPHPSARFEGYYSKFCLPSGAKLVIIICSVPEARKNPHMVSFTYVPEDISKIYQEEIWVGNIKMLPRGRDGTFQLSIPGIGFMKCDTDGKVCYELRGKNFEFSGTSSNSIPWLKNQCTPAGLLARLPLPIQWHVHSRRSLCEFQLRLPQSAHRSLGDQAGFATVHQEKNWGASFPRSHIWIQAWKGSRGFCCAGGSVWGMEAYLLGYHSPYFSFDFKPPWSLRIFGWSPFISVDANWERRSVTMNVQRFFRRVAITATAPEGSFFGLSAPFTDGHKPNFLAESFEASIHIKVCERSWSGAWVEIHSDKFEHSSLEFGGDLYPFHGTSQSRH